MRAACGLHDMGTANHRREMLRDKGGIPNGVDVVGQKNARLPATKVLCAIEMTLPCWQIQVVRL